MTRIHGAARRLKIFPALLLGFSLAGCVSSPKATKPTSKIDKLNERAIAFHERRCLNDASTFYRQVLALDPPKEPSPAQIAAVMKFAPRLYTIAHEFFPLNDVVAIIHPDKPIIGYHLFWGDDIDFPDDHDPTDHEIVWVEYDPASQEVREVYTYFHDHILRTDEAPANANANQRRAWVGVEWGKHGSLPWDAAGLLTGEPNSLLKEDWQILSTKGIRRPDHPLARAWPSRFPGDFDAYRSFTMLVDPSRLLEQKKMITVSRWANAVIDENFLPYNFAPKTEWP
jgi:hypothetical protein